MVFAQTTPKKWCVGINGEEKNCVETGLLHGGANYKCVFSPYLIGLVKRGSSVVEWPLAAKSVRGANPNADKSCKIASCENISDVKIL